MLVLLILAALALAWANGSNDNFKATATLYGSGTLDYRRSLRLATAAQLAGSVASVFLAGALLRAFSGNGLVPAAVVGDPRFLIAVACAGASTVLVATRFGLPISTTHSLIGGLVGAGLVMAPGELAWGALGGKYFVPLAVSPLLAIAAAGALYPVGRFVRRRLGWHEQTCLCVGAAAQPVEVLAGGAMALRGSGRLLTVGELESCQPLYGGSLLGLSAQTLVDTAHKGSAFALGFARGLNDTPKILALLVAAGWSGLDGRVSLVVVAAAMAGGGLVMSRRVAETMGHKITGMNRGQGLVANTVASALVIGASLLGSPVSTTHTSTGAIFGIGMWTGSADWKVASGIVVAWVAALPLAALVAAAVVLAL